MLILDISFQETEAFSALVFVYLYSRFVRRVCSETYEEQIIVSSSSFRYGIGIMVRWPLQAKDFCLLFGILRLSQFPAQRLPGAM